MDAVGVKVLNVKLVKMANLFYERQPEPRSPGFFAALPEAFEKTLRVAFQDRARILHAEFCARKADVDITARNIVDDSVPEKVVDQDFHQGRIGLQLDRGFDG